MRFNPRTNKTIRYTLLLILALLGLDLAAWWWAFRRPWDVVAAMLGLAAALGLAALATAIWWWHAQRGIRYELDRNRLLICGIDRAWQVPLGTISEISQTSVAIATMRGLNRWGYRIGEGRMADGGEAVFCLTAPDDPWIIRAADRAYLLSPADPESLVEAWQERLKLGPTQTLQPGAQPIGLFTRPLWQNRAWMLTWGSALVLSVLLIAHVGWYGPQQQPLWQTDAMRVPAVALTIWAFNGLLGWLLFRSERPLSYLLIVTGLLAQVLAWQQTTAIYPAGPAGQLFYGLLIGLALSAAIGILGYRRQSLSGSGVLGAMLVGTLILGLGGGVWGMLLIAFFASSSALSHYKERRKAALAEKFAKDGRRDFGQTMANGGLGALLALLSTLAPNPLWLPAFVGVMAAVNADTWATELGVLSKRPPRLITTWKAVPPGTSGGISLLGLAASLGGALFIGLLALMGQGVASLFAGQPLPAQAWWLPLLAAAGGMLGSVVDSLLGATVQVIYYCERCQKETEREIHLCGERTLYLCGWEWLDNDLVNLISSALGGLLAVLLAQWVW